MSVDLRTITVTEFCTRTGMKRCTAYALIASGALKTIRPLGARGNFRILESSVETLYANAQPHASEPQPNPHRDALRRAADDAVLPRDGALAFQ